MPYSLLVVCGMSLVGTYFHANLISILSSSEKLHQGPWQAFLLCKGNRVSGSKIFSGFGTRNPSKHRNKALSKYDSAFGAIWCKTRVHSSKWIRVPALKLHKGTLIAKERVPSRKI
jgi:hypothetical protein